MSEEASSARLEADDLGYNDVEEVQPGHSRRSAASIHTKSQHAKTKASTVTRKLSKRRWSLLYGFGLLAMSLFVNPAQAVMVQFQNCLPESYQNNVPTALQFSPLFVDASFDTTGEMHNLHITVYGNVTGTYRNVTLPPSNDPAWTNPEITDGKIENLPYPGTKYTTLFNKINVLTYEPWSQNVNFCDQLVNGTCPLAPSFSAKM